MGMTFTEVRGEYKGHQIVVLNQTDWFLFLQNNEPETKLYIDGKVVDTMKGSISNAHNAAILRGSIIIDECAHIVEIYGAGSRTKKFKICVDGAKIAGDLA